MAGKKKGKKKPSRERYKAEGRRAKNKKRRADRHKRRVAELVAKSRKKKPVMMGKRKD